MASSSGPGILYACVCSGTHKSADAGTAPSTVSLTAFIDGTMKGPFANQDKGAFNHDVCSYNYIKSNGFTFIAVAPKEVETRIVYEFLAEMVMDFQIGADREAYEVRLRLLLAKYGNPVDKIAQAAANNATTMAIMKANLEAMLARGEIVDAADLKAFNLENDAHTFAGQAEAVRKCARWKQLRLRILICFVVLVVIFVGLVAGCGGFSFPRCGGTNTSTTKNVHIGPGALTPAPASPTPAPSSTLAPSS